MTLYTFLLALLMSTIMTPNESESITSDNQNQMGDIAVFVDNVQVNQGVVYVGLFNSKKTFRKIKKVYKVETLIGSRDEGVVVLEDVPYDEYAIIIFQDYNDNQKFDKNFMGVPKEPFGFSTNFIVSTRAPKYGEVTFTHDDEETELNVNLQIF